MKLWKNLVGPQGALLGAMALGATADELKVWLRHLAEPRIFGSAAQNRCSRWMVEQLTRQLPPDQAQVWREGFRVATPARACREVAQCQASEMRQGWNVVAWVPGRLSCAIILASHYDAKELYWVPRREQRGYQAALDGGASSALLGVLAQEAAQQPRTGCGRLFVWFDGEEAVLRHWHQARRQGHPVQPDHTYGSRTFAAKLRPCVAGPGWCLAHQPTHQVRAMMLLDLIGRKGMRLSQDGFATPELAELQRRILKADSALGVLGTALRWIEDDHHPFLTRGIPALNWIDMENLEHWHHPSDRSELVSIFELRRVGRWVQAAAAELDRGQLVPAQGQGAVTDRSGL